MLDLREAAQQARQRIEDRLAAADKNKKSVPRSAQLVQLGSSFKAHLIDSLRRTGDEQRAPSLAPEALFLAFPEKLLGKWYYLAFGPQRNKGGAVEEEARISDEWHGWDKLGSETKIVNFSSIPPRAVLLAHGLSPIEDSIFLLADIGRASRAARALNVPLKVMLADVSWISHNRSIRRFDLPEQELENGLSLCQARRKRLYESVRAEVNVHEIVMHNKKGAISRQKIQKIANHYLQLTEQIWGKEKINTATPLSNEDVKSICRPLQTSLGADSGLQFLADFPGAILSLEKALLPHLSVIRTLAQKFRILSPDTFSYYFAQYYAQDEYRGTHLKVAPVSESDFDEPYDSLDASFRLWGEGHNPSIETDGTGTPRKKKMTAVYLPQYRIGDWSLLPYSPLSLDSLVKSDGKIQKVRENVILTSDCRPEHSSKIKALLWKMVQRGGVEQLNRLVADLISFLQLCVIEIGLPESTALSRSSVDLPFVDFLKKINLDLGKMFEAETDEAGALGDLWLAWLDSIDRNGDFQYVPCHLQVARMTKEDWNEDSIAAAAQLVLCTNKIATELSTS